jgi:hypothetical protein
MRGRWDPLFFNIPSKFIQLIYTKFLKYKMMKGPNVPNILEVVSKPSIRFKIKAERLI